MIIDKELELSSAQAITATAVSENVIDLVNVRDIGEGEQTFIYVNVVEAFTDAGSDSTVAVTLVTDDNATLTSPTVIRTLVTLPALSAAGTLLFFAVEPEQLVEYERYLALNYTVANGNLTSGKINAGIVKDISKFKAYAKNFVVA